MLNELVAAANSQSVNARQCQPEWCRFTHFPCLGQLLSRPIAFNSGRSQSGRPVGEALYGRMSRVGLLIRNPQLVTLAPLETSTAGARMLFFLIFDNYLSFHEHTLRKIISCLFFNNFCSEQKADIFSPCVFNNFCSYTFIF
jgi:hypothetical protein